MNTEAISSTINNMFNVPKGAAMQLPSMLVAIGATQKPGLSDILSIGNFTKELEEHNIPTGALPDGTENNTMVIVIAIVKEIFRAMREDASIQVSYPIGSISVMSQGANAAGPVVTQGVNINFPKGQGVIL